MLMMEKKYGQKWLKTAYKFALLWGEAQLCLPYVYLQNEKSNYQKGQAALRHYAKHSALPL